MRREPAPLCLISNGFKIVPMLSDGSYYKASDTYIEICADTPDLYAEKGAPLDSGNDPAKDDSSSSGNDPAKDDSSSSGSSTDSDGFGGSSGGKF